MIMKIKIMIKPRMHMHMLAWAAHRVKPAASGVAANAVLQVEPGHAK